MPDRSFKMECPDCKWEYIMEDFSFYKMEDGEISTLSPKDFAELDFQKAKDYYPKKNNILMLFEKGRFIHEWDEIYFCPDCCKEFVLKLSDGEDT